jgi:hypothetical protein
MRSIIYKIYTGQLYTPQLFTVQSRNLLLLKYAVHLFHPEIINIFTEYKQETFIHLHYGIFISLKLNRKKNIELKYYFIPLIHGYM